MLNDQRITDCCRVSAILKISIWSSYGNKYTATSFRLRAVFGARVHRVIENFYQYSAVLIIHWNTRASNLFS